MTRRGSLLPKVCFEKWSTIFLMVEGATGIESGLSPLVELFQELEQGGADFGLGLFLEEG
jgi:hypothetical protein